MEGAGDNALARKRKLSLPPSTPTKPIQTEPYEPERVTKIPKTRKRYSVLFTMRLPPESLRHFREVRQALQDAGVTLDIASWEKEGAMPPERLLSMISANSYDAICCTVNDTIDEKICKAAKDLRVVSTVSVGYNHISIDTCIAHHISVLNTPDVLTDTTADLVVGLMLATARRFPEALEAVSTGAWQSWEPLWMCGTDLHHSVVGIVGLGRIGLAVAKRLRGFDCRIIYYSRNRNLAAEREVQAEYVSMDELLSRADFVVPLCPLSDATRHMFNQEAFSKMKSKGVFINASRGGLCDSAALYQALKARTITAAGLDVTDPEPINPTDPLCELPNCVILPHIGSASTATRTKMANLAIDNLIAGLLHDEPPMGWADKLQRAIYVNGTHPDVNPRPPPTPSDAAAAGTPMAAASPSAAATASTD